MELLSIEMEQEAAKQAFHHYREAVKRRHDAEDYAIMVGYRALAKGVRLIRLSETLKAGGTTTVSFRDRVGATIEKLVPMVAVTRADAKIAYTTGIGTRGECEITADKQRHELAPNNRRDRTVIRAGTFEGPKHSPNPWRCVRAIVPNVPPPLRPADALSKYHVLWEAEWSLAPVPPGDPALLKHIGGDLYAVCAVWDLTELEQAVLAGRA